MNDHLFKRAEIMDAFFNKNHVRATSDGLSYAVFRAQNLPVLSQRQSWKCLESRHTK